MRLVMAVGASSCISHDHRKAGQASGSKHDGNTADKKSQRGETMNRIKASERERLLRIYAQTRTIAVVGASADASKAAHQIPLYLQRQGDRILPVNPPD